MVPGQPHQKKKKQKNTENKKMRPPLPSQQEKNLGTVAHTCHLSYCGGHKIGLWSRPAGEKKKLSPK
jgi:hypothetical protein